MRAYQHRVVGALLPILFLFVCASSSKAKAEPLRSSLTFYASFDHGLDADYARGNKTLFGANNRSKPNESQPGLPAGNAIELAEGKGRFGGALKFKEKSDAIVLFKGRENLAHQATNWSGSISFWLRLNPDEDLQPGYCDPLQISAGNWNKGVFFAEFSKDTPRRFRFALRPLLPIWNPDNKGWEAIPASERPMVEVEKPPFSREQWTHVVFVFENANSGPKDGRGRLFLNGVAAGEFKNWDLTTNWKPDDILLILGVFYVGHLDDVALFNRPLTPGEIQTIYGSTNGLHHLLKNN